MFWLNLYALVSRKAIQNICFVGRDMQFDLCVPERLVQRLIALRYEPSSDFLIWVYLMYVRRRDRGGLSVLRPRECQQLLRDLPLVQWFPHFF